MIRDTSRRRGRARARNNPVTFDLAEMSRYLHPSDEKVLNEGVIVPRFSEFQLPSWNASLGVALPNPVGSMVDEPPRKAEDPDVESVSAESVEADADIKTVHDGAVRAILTESGLWELPSGETPVSAPQNTTDVVVASASEGDYFWNGAPLQRPRLMPTTKIAPRPKPSATPARVIAATTSTPSSSSNARVSSMVSNLVRENVYLRDSETAAGAYQRFVEDLLPANSQDTEQHESDYE